jgi:hypothetical protein
VIPRIEVVSIKPLVTALPAPAVRSLLSFAECPLLALFGHPPCTHECPLSGVRRT